METLHLIGAILLSITCYIACGEGDEYLLPSTLIPERYDLKIEVFDITNSNYEGKVKIQVICKEETDVVKLYYNDLEIKDNSTKITFGSDGQEVAIGETNRTTIKKGERMLYTWYEIKPAGGFRFQPDNQYYVYLEFSGALANHNIEGFSRSSFLQGGNQQGEVRYNLYTTIKTGARYIFPCFDEPQFRAFFKVEIHVPISYVPVFTTPLTMQDESGSTRAVYVSEDPPTIKISPHQLTFVLSKLKQEVWNDRLTIWVQSGDNSENDNMQTLNGAKNSSTKPFNVMVKMIMAYEEYFNASVPKLSVISLPKVGRKYNFAVLIQELNLLVDDITAEEAFRAAEDIAGLWLDGLVTVNCWSDLWYSVALRKHLSSLAVEKACPEHYVAEEKFIERLEVIYKYGSLKNSFPLTVEISNHEDVYTRLSDVVFQEKGAVLIRMFSKLMGDGNFQNVMKRFIADFKGSNATSEQLVDMLKDSFLGSASDENTMEEKQQFLFSLFTFITQKWFPLVKVTRSPEDRRKITLTQMPYILHGKDNETAWTIPIYYSTDKNDTFEIGKPEWLFNRPLEIFIDNDTQWVILNNQMTGLYRIDYDDYSWMAIAKALNDNATFEKVHVLNRVQLLMDSFDYTENSIAKYKNAFYTYAYLRLEVEYLPWKVASKRMKELSKFLYRSPAQDIFQEYMHILLRKLWAYAETERSKGLQKMGISIKFIHFIFDLTCHFELNECIKYISNRFEQVYSKHDSDPSLDNLTEEIGAEIHLPREFNRKMMCIGIQTNDTRWNYFFHMIRTAFTINDNLDSSKEDLLFALSCSKVKKTQLSYLDSFITNGHDGKPFMPLKYLPKAFAYTLKNRDAYESAKDWIFEKAEDIKRRENNQNILFPCVKNIVTKASSGAELDEVNRRISNHWQLPMRVFNKAYMDTVDALGSLREHVNAIVPVLEKIVLALKSASQQ